MLLDNIQMTSYNISMIKSFKQSGLKQFFLTGNTKGIQAIHAEKINLILTAMNRTTRIEQLNIPAFRLHRLKGDMSNLWSVTVQANWRITFKFDETTQDIYIVDYQDYH